MSMALPSSLASSTPLTQNTAPVFEHRCLFTHDLRRKAKRWQDGFLKFHTFNKRVMVYDVTRNYIGDSHHRTAGPDGLEDGDELELERGGALVQVGERVGTEQTDVRELVTRRQPKPIDQVDKGSARIPTQLQPRSTNLSVPPRTPARWTGWTGRAQIPQESPFAQRTSLAKATEEEWEQGRAVKRRKTEDDEHVPLWQILKTSRQPIRNTPASSAATPALWARTADARASGKVTGSSTISKKKTAIPSSQARFQVKEVIDIASSQDEDHAPPGVFNSPSPAKPAPARRAAPAKVNVVQTKLNQTVGARDLGPLSQDVVRAFRPPTRPNLAQAAESSMARKQQRRRPAQAPLRTADPEQPVREEEGEEQVAKVGPRRNLTNNYRGPPSDKRMAEVSTPQRLPRSSPPVSTRSHIHVPADPISIDLTMDDIPSKVTSKKPMKPLKLGGSSRPKMLLMCQQPPASRSAFFQTEDPNASSDPSSKAKRLSEDSGLPQRARSDHKGVPQDTLDSTPAFGTMDTARPLRRRSASRSRSPVPLSDDARDEPHHAVFQPPLTSAPIIEPMLEEEEVLEEPADTTRITDNMSVPDFVEDDTSPRDEIASSQKVSRQDYEIQRLPIQHQQMVEATKRQAVTEPNSKPDVCGSDSPTTGRPTSEAGAGAITRRSQMLDIQESAESLAASNSQHIVTTRDPIKAPANGGCRAPLPDTNNQHPDVLMFANSRKPTEPQVVDIVGQKPFHAQEIHDVDVSRTLTLSDIRTGRTRIPANELESSKLHDIQPVSAKSGPVAKAASSLHSALEPAEQMATIQAAPPAVMEEAPQGLAKRTLRRTTSDAGPVSPMKAGPTSQPNPPRQPKKPFGRASTVLNPAAAAKEQQRAVPGEPVVVDEAALQNEKRLADMRNEKGPWTKEAWDLFGWCPKAKAESLAWEYGKNGDAAAMAEGPEPVGQDGLSGGTSGNMNEVRALGGFVSAATTRRVAVA